MAEQPEKSRFRAVLRNRLAHQQEQIDKLQKALEREQNARKEERFVLLVFVIILFDIAFFTLMPSFGGPIAILVLELIILIPIARRMGIPRNGKNNRSSA